MKEPLVDMSTDAAWEEWGHRDPYYGVITHPRFRRSQMTLEALTEFFDSGRQHVDFVMQVIRRDIDPTFAPKAVLDFGCGVGRTLLPFASLAQRVVGIDVSPSMLLEAAHNRDKQRLANVELVCSDDALSSLTDTYDLIHSFIVFQHIPCERGYLLFSKLLQHLTPNGIGAVHFTYSKSHFAATNGLPPHATLPRAHSSPTPNGGDPEMQMNPYNMNQLLFLLQHSGVHRVRFEYTDHGGELGVFLFFQRASESTVLHF